MTVTGDRAILNLRIYQEIRILSLRQFLEERSILNSQNGATGSSVGQKPSLRERLALDALRKELLLA